MCTKFKVKEFKTLRNQKKTEIQDIYQTFSSLLGLECQLNFGSGFRSVRLRFTGNSIVVIVIIILRFRLITIRHHFNNLLLNQNKQRNTS